MGPQGRRANTASTAPPSKQDEAAQEFNKKVCELLDAQDARELEAAVLDALDLTPPNVPLLSAVSCPAVLAFFAGDNLSPLFCFLNISRCRVCVGFACVWIACWNGAQTTIQGLIVLAHAGSVQTQRVFVMAMRNAVALGSAADKESQAMADNARQNRRALFTNAPAKHLLKQLLRCAAWGDAEIRQIADEALAALSADVAELIANAKYCIESADLEICQWVALSLFRRTINPNDESNQHLIYTIESMHPYAANTHITGRIIVLGASQLSITFDPVSLPRRTNDSETCFPDFSLLASDTVLSDFCCPALLKRGEP